MVNFNVPGIPPITHGPIEVSVTPENLLQVSHITDLLENLSPTERFLLAFDVQQVINRWADRKHIPHS